MSPFELHLGQTSTVFFNMDTSVVLVSLSDFEVSRKLVAIHSLIASSMSNCFEISHSSRVNHSEMTQIFKHYLKKAPLPRSVCEALDSKLFVKLVFLFL